MRGALADALSDLGDVDHRLVLGTGSDQMRAPLPVGARNTANCQIVAFRAATGEDDLGWLAIEYVGNCFTGMLNGGFSILAEAMY